MTAPPRLVVRTLAVTFVMVASILSVVFIVLMVDAGDRVRASAIEELRASERAYTGLEVRRRQDRLALVTTLAENPTLKAALDTYVTESGFGTLTPRDQQFLHDTVAREADKLAAVISADVVAVIDSDDRVFTSAGAAREQWPPGAAVALRRGAETATQGVALVEGQAFLASAASLRFGDRDTGTLVLATNLDVNYARELASLARTGIVITLQDAVVAATVPEAVTRDLTAADRDFDETWQLDGEEYAVRLLLDSDRARIYALSSIDAATRAATREALIALGAIALGSFILAGVGSLWLARTVTEPINRVSTEIATMTMSRAFGHTLEPSGSSREVDALALAFNDLMRGLAHAEAETRAAYLGAIRALAAALDARDPYTAGHSERVSAFSVLIAKQLNLAEADVDVIRLGALLHDIGKIGVPDDVLRKPGPLTLQEFEQIKRHPALGARILRQVPFLAPHLPIVELHHERPDGRGYPFGLRADDIPLAARIVHVADAFDAMTSARAYRPAKGVAFAVDELRRGAGTDFDTAAVQAACVVLPEATSMSEPQLQELLGRGV